MWVQMTTKVGEWFSNTEMVKGFLKMSMQDAVQSPELKEKVVPDYEIGVKRPVLSDDYLQSMNKPNFSLVTSGIKSVTQTGIVTKMNKEIDTDVLIFATGFDVLKSILAFDVRGQNGQQLKNVWKNSPKVGVNCLPKIVFERKADQINEFLLEF